MKDKLYITIPTPCTQPWQSMTPVDGGRHFAHCDKTVTDFSAYTDVQLYHFFSQQSEPLCGSMLTTQLSRSIIPPAQQGCNKVYGLVLALGLTILAAGYPARKSYAQSPMAQSHLVGDTAAPAGNSAILSGNITMDGGDPLEKAVVAVYAGSVCAAISSTDKAGDFSLNIEPGHYTVKVSFVGMDTVQRTMEVLAQHNTHMTATLQQPPQPIVTVTESLTAGGPMISYRDLASITTARYLSAKTVKHKGYKKVKRKTTHKKRRR